MRATSWIPEAGFAVEAVLVPPVVWHITQVPVAPSYQSKAVGVVADGWLLWQSTLLQVPLVPLPAV